MTPEFGNPRTAIVTGGARRIGAAFVRALGEDGWHVLIHCRDSCDEADQVMASLPPGRGTVVCADLARPDAAELVFGGLAGLPPPALLVNNASLFAQDGFDDFDVAGWEAHHAANLRAPALLTRAFARAVPAGQNGLVVNMLDAKLAQPNPDFFTYTLSKIGLAGLTELSGRVLAGRGIRVCGIAPSVTLVSGAQTRENFDAVHRMNALARGVTVEQIVAALRFIVASPTLTGQTILIDGGQRFLALPRDVQFMGTE